MLVAEQPATVTALAATAKTHLVLLHGLDRASYAPTCASCRSIARLASPSSKRSSSGSAVASARKTRATVVYSRPSGSGGWRASSSWQRCPRRPETFVAGEGPFSGSPA